MGGYSPARKALVSPTLLQGGLGGDEVAIGLDLQACP